MIIIYNLNLLTTLPSFADYQTLASNTKNHSDNYPIFFFTLIISNYFRREESQNNEVSSGCVWQSKNDYLSVFCLIDSQAHWVRNYIQRRLIWG